MISFIAIMSASSCDPDPENNNEPTLVGTWRYDFSSGYTLMHFNSNGTGWEQEIENGSIEATEYFEYTYSTQNRTIVFIYFDDEEDIEIVNNVTITDTQLIYNFTDIEEETYIWTRA